MLMIRLQRVGRKNDPSFRVVVTDSHNAAKKSGRFLRVVGNYDPRRNWAQVDAEAIKTFIKHGAKLSPTVHNILINLQVIEGKKKNVLPKKTVPVVAAPETSAETPVETPAAEPIQAGSPQSEDVITAEPAAAPAETEASVASS